jgi:hypothetical protein
VLTGDQTATNFNADAQIKLFQHTLFNNLQLDDSSNFAIAQVANSTALNPKIARVLGIKHIACHNHCLNLGCKDMEKHYSELRDIADMTQEVHRKVKARNCLAHGNNLHGYRGRVQIYGIKDTCIQSTYVQITYIVS